MVPVGNMSDEDMDMGYEYGTYFSLFYTLRGVVGLWWAGARKGGLAMSNVDACNGEFIGL